MDRLVEGDDALVVRTDFSDERTWEAVRAEVSAPVGALGFTANVTFVDDRRYEGATKEQVAGLVGPTRSFVMIADRETMTAPHHPLLVLDLLEEPGGEFRAASRTIHAVENNMSLGNMDFEDFVSAVDDDGVFRDFRDP